VAVGGGLGVFVGKGVSDGLIVAVGGTGVSVVQADISQKLIDKMVM
jgi:hypothetical protein